MLHTTACQVKIGAEVGMGAARLRWNFGLQRAVDHAVAFKKPLIILEALRCDYPGANDRLHQFILDGMAVNRRHANGSPR